MSKDYPSEKGKQGRSRKHSSERKTTLPFGYMYFKEGCVGHTFESIYGYRVIKINNKLCNGRPQHMCDPNVILLRNNHFGVTADNATVKDMGIVEDDVELWKHKIANLTEAERIEYAIED